MQRMISHRERLETCLSGEKPDRTPVALWRHFPVDDQSSKGLASAALNFQRAYDFDFIKVTPESSYCLKDWGVTDEWRGATEGTRDYTYRVIQQAQDWEKLPLLDPYSDNLKRQLKCLELIVNEIGDQTPVIQTIFNPLSQAKNLVGNENLIVHLRRYPELVHAGLKTITESTIRFIEAAHQTGVSGVFFAVQHAQFGILTSEEYDTFGKHYDLKVLEPVKDFWFNVLHIHGKDIMFEKFLNYPVQVLNWHDKDTRPTITEAMSLYPGVVCGGLQREKTLVLGTPESVRAEANQAIQISEGNRFILGTGCVVPITAPHGNIMSARKSVEVV